MKWEYLLIEPGDKRAPERQELLNDLGNQGWELVQVVGDYWVNQVIYLKRQISN